MYNDREELKLGELQMGGLTISIWTTEVGETLQGREPLVVNLSRNHWMVTWEYATLQETIERLEENGVQRVHAILAAMSDALDSSVKLVLAEVENE